MITKDIEEELAAGFLAALAGRDLATVVKRPDSPFIIGFVCGSEALQIAKEAQAEEREIVQ